MRKRLIGISSAIAAVLVFGAAGDAVRAQAPAAPTFERLDVNEDGVLSGIEMKSAASRDVNGDGRVTRAEFEGASSIANAPVAGGAAEDERLFAERDITEDGFLSGKEVKGFEALDADGDRLVTKAEFLAGRASARKPVPGAKANPAAAARLATAFFQAFDKNEDGRLSGTEIEPGMEAYDADNNGRITRDEFVAGETSDPEADLAATATALLLHGLKTGNVSPFVSAMHADLRKKVEEPVLRWIVAEVRKEYGELKEVENLATIDTVSDGAASRETTADVSFTKSGDRGKVRVTTVEGEVLGFNLEIPVLNRLGEILYGRIASDQKFAREVADHFSPRGKELVELAVAGKDAEAYARFHPEFQKQFALETVKQLFASIRDEAGPVRSVEWDGVTSHFGPDGKPLHKFSLEYDVVGEKVKFQAIVAFEFDGMGGTIAGVNFKQVD
jgi:hypothetical protein